MADKAKSPCQPSTAGRGHDGEQGSAAFSKNSLEACVSTVERLEELMGAVAWLKTDQARKGAYQNQDELNELLTSMERVSRIMEEARKGWPSQLGKGDPSAAGSSPSPKDGLASLLDEVDRAILSLTADRLVLKGGEIERIRNGVERMEQEIQKRIDSLKEV